MLRKLLIIVPILVIFFIALAFGAQNATEVTVNFLLFKAQLSVAAVAGIFLGVGFFISVIFYFLSTLRWKLRYRRLSKKFSALESKAPESNTKE